MADTKISALTAASVLADTDELVLASGGVSKKLTGANLKPGYGTSLPGSPVNGQEHILVDSLTNPTYQWRFRYNAGSSSAYKWECIGGSEWYGETTGTDTISSGTPANLTNDPTFTLPRAGDWLIEVDAVSASTVADGQNFYGAGDAAVAASVINGAFGQSPSANRWSTIRSKGRANGLASGVVVRGKAWGTGGGTLSYMFRRLSVRPVRVS